MSIVKIEKEMFVVGLFGFLTKANNWMSNFNFTFTMEQLAKEGDAQTKVFTNICRVDGASISSYAVDTALDNNAPVYLLTDQGMVLLVKSGVNNNLVNTIVPPVPGDYICFTDGASKCMNVETEYYRYIIDEIITSNDIYAYWYDDVKHVLYCSTNEKAVKEFEEVMSYRRNTAN